MRVLEDKHNNGTKSVIAYVESGVYYKRHSLRGYVLNMFTTYECSLSRLQYCIALFEACRFRYSLNWSFLSSCSIKELSSFVFLLTL